MNISFVFLQRITALESLPTALGLADEPGVASTRLLVLFKTTNRKSLRQEVQSLQQEVQTLRQEAQSLIKLSAKQEAVFFPQAGQKGVLNRKHRLTYRKHSHSCFGGHSLSRQETQFTRCETHSL